MAYVIKEIVVGPFITAGPYPVSATSLVEISSALRFQFTPKASGKYRLSIQPYFEQTTPNNEIFPMIQDVAGTFVFVQQNKPLVGSTANQNASFGDLYAIAQLTAGTVYTFTIWGAVNLGTSTLWFQGTEQWVAEQLL